MSVIPGVAKAASVKVLTGTRPASKPLPKTKRTLVVMALVLFAPTAFATLVSASVTSNMEHYSLWSKDSQSGAAPVSEPRAAPQMSER